MRVAGISEGQIGTVGVVSRCKRGDFVATLGETCGAPGSKVVVEVKDQPLRLKDAVDELQEAKKNREAACGIFVFANGTEPAEVVGLRRIGEDFTQRLRLRFGEDPLLCPRCHNVMQRELIQHPDYGIIQDYQSELYSMDPVWIRPMNDSNPKPDGYPEWLQQRLREMPWDGPRVWASYRCRSIPTGLKTSS